MNTTCFAGFTFAAVANSDEGRKTSLEITAAGTVAGSHGIPLLILTGISGLGAKDNAKNEGIFFGMV